MMLFWIYFQLATQTKTEIRCFHRKKKNRLAWLSEFCIHPPTMLLMCSQSTTQCTIQYTHHPPWIDCFCICLDYLEGVYCPVAPEKIDFSHVHFTVSKRLNSCYVTTSPTSYSLRDQITKICRILKYYITSSTFLSEST